MAYFNKKTVENIYVAGKRMLLLCDFNISLDENRKITSTRKINASLKTIKYLLEHNAKVIICSRLENPGGTIGEEFSLKPIADILTSKLDFEVKLTDDIIGPNAKKLCDSLKEGEAVLLENLNFKIEDQNNDENFAKELACLADIFVNDDYAGLHRECASNCGVTRFLPSVGGFLVQKEIETVLSILESPNRPFVAIFGGSKLSSNKLGAITKLLEKLDTLIIGGGIAYTFMNALGYSVGASVCEHDKAEAAKKLMIMAKEKGVKLVMPVDSIVGLTYNPNTEFKLVNSDNIPESWMGLDIGPETEKLFSNAIKKASTVFWTGAMGVFEWSNFASGTIAIAKAVAENSEIDSDGKVAIICGGGSSTVTVEKLGYSNKAIHISAGSETTLRLITDKTLPGVENLLA